MTQTVGVLIDCEQQTLSHMLKGLFLDCLYRIKAAQSRHIRIRIAIYILVAGNWRTINRATWMLEQPI